MDIAWYKAVIDGRTQDLLQLMDNPDIAWRDATPLHVALQCGKVELAQEIAWRHPQLVTHHDTNHETPLHCALVAGYDSFLLWCLEPTANDLERERVVNIEAAASDSLLDGAGRSLLYLAAEKGTPELVQALLTSPLGSTSCGPNRLTALHAAIFRYENSGNRTAATEIIQALMNHQPQLSRERDGFGNTPLHYAAALEEVDVVYLLLRSDISAAYIRNKEGLSPVHVAASLGLVDTFQWLVRLCPGSGFATTARGMNVLHLSVQAQEEDMVRHILASRELSNILINGKDGDGNTPYHLSLFLPNDTIRGILLQNDTLDREAWNNEGLTFKDMKLIKSRLHLKPPPDPCTIIRDGRLHGFARMKFMRNKEASPPSYMRNKEVNLPREAERERIETLRNTSNVLMLVATLIITVTFTATATIPGGYNGSEPDEGMATLARSAALKIFVISDSLSLGFSVVALFHLAVGAFASSPRLTGTGAAASMGLIQWAVLSMLVAFEMGIYLVMEAHSRPTAIAVLVITCLVPLIYSYDAYGFGWLPPKTRIIWYPQFIQEWVSWEQKQKQQAETMFDQRVAELILKP